MLRKYDKWRVSDRDRTQLTLASTKSMLNGYPSIENGNVKIIGSMKGPVLPAIKCDAGASYS